MSDDSAFLERLSAMRRGFQESKVVLAAAELGLFDRLHRGPARAGELAADLGATRRGVTILADALVALGLLDKADGAYRNQPATDRHLVLGQPGSKGYALRHSNRMFRSWARLEDVVREGALHDESDKPVLTDPEANRSFIMTMAEVSAERVGPLVDHLPLGGARRFVDLGAGPGHYACEAARRHPELAVAVVDLPLTIEVARDYIGRAGLADRVDTLVCDFYRQRPLELGGPADLVLISQVLHAEGPAENRDLLAALRPHVRAGGAVVIAENLVAEDRSGPLEASLFAVNMLAGTARGNTYTEREIAGWLEAAGFSPEPARHIAPRTALITARAT